ncbi:DUF397 domain-containing protein [Streptomyces sp. 3MP-14]|uniref:DUF397 domain-containing protein n=1 Tax=Streptomyces mimosae TaxID=2586635 RepID=A0A5N6AQF7_9ACTN|nr:MULTISPECIES: DUF397 domain-containing protein [Streptomyces]KAB8169868.1 DUF397 domain-containing protein [Streptomyces mimosae]KAB8178616.1 DUF397 domain-containing protein [Streptomyces sp. 3MP-14]
MNTLDRFAAAEWVKSSYSQGTGGECVEFSRTFASAGVVPVRDSKQSDVPALDFPLAGWASFVAAVRRGELPS